MQTITAKLLEAVASCVAARGCQRDGWTTLRGAATILRDLLPIPLRAEARLECDQVGDNAECIGQACPLYA